MGRSIQPAGHPPLPTKSATLFSVLFSGLREKIHNIFSRDWREKEEKIYIYTHIRPDKYSKKLGPRFDVWDTPCPDRGQLTKSMKRREVYNLSRGTNPLLSRYKHNRAIYTYRDGLHSKLIIDDTSRGWSIIKGLPCSRHGSREIAQTEGYRWNARDRFEKSEESRTILILCDTLVNNMYNIITF